VVIVELKEKSYIVYETKESMLIDKKKLGEKLHTNREALRAQNKWAGGRVPLGYSAYRGLLRINKKEKKALEKILELTLEGYSVYQIWNILKKQGYKNRDGNEISRNAIYRALEEKRIEVYLGHRYQTPIAKKEEKLYELLLKFA
jgi:site-specific DNA recombinase